MSFQFAICKDCQYYRRRTKTVLFKSTPATSKASLKKDDNDEQLRLLEKQRFDLDYPFDYEPYSYAWCAACTPFDNQLLDAIKKGFKPDESLNIQKIAMESVSRGMSLIDRASNGDQEALLELAERGRATFSPISGEVKQIYSLCDRINSQGQCPLFEQKKVD